MEIPYTVTAREDTGLWNAKLGIWLFLASEVMLFGGLFSGYIFLRLGAGADPLYHWPSQELKILPGFVNTLVLIASSVTVVMAWASLKMRKWAAYRFYMFITLGCALAFMCIKSYEYYGKFTHSSVRLVDGTVVDGHIHQDVLVFENVSAITVPVLNPDLSFLDKYAFTSHATHHGEAAGGSGAHAHPEGEAGRGGADPEKAATGHEVSAALQFLTPEGEVIDLNDVLANGSDWASLNSASGINDAGQIVGYGKTIDGENRAYVLTIVPIPAAVWLFASGLGLLGWFRCKKAA